MKSMPAVLTAFTLISGVRLAATAMQGPFAFE